MRKGTTGEARQHVDASPAALYALVTDVTRMGDWSPECARGEWVDGASGPTVGARFRGRNRHGLARWSTKVRVVTAEPGRAFAFVAPDLRGRDNTRWTYGFEAAPSGGTEVTERFEVLRDASRVIRFVYRVVMGVTDRRADLEANMRHTLAALKGAAEGATPGPS